MHISERISALLDNAGDRTDQTALAAIARDPAARRTWSRYQLIGDSLRDGEIPQKNQPGTCFWKSEKSSEVVVCRPGSTLASPNARRSDGTICSVSAGSL